MPFPLLDGGAYSLYHTALGLIFQKTDVRILAINTPKNWIDSKCIPHAFKEKTKFEYSIVDTRFKPWQAFFNVFTNKSYFVERFFSEKFKNDLIRVLENEKFDIIQLEHVYMCLYLDTIRKYSNAKVILRPQNVENKVWDRVMKNKINPLKKIFICIAANRLKKFEIAMANKVDGIIAISSCDADLFSIYAPKIPLVTVPIGFDFSKMNSYNLNSQFLNFPVFYHLGSMDWLPNIQGIKWFVKEVIPLIKEDCPEFVLRIAGKKIPKMFYELQSINLIVDGQVEDSMKYQEDKAILIVPLLSGGGLRAKIIEGMALGKTIISTTIGAEGIPYTNQENILIANSKEEFVVQIKKSLNSKELCREIGLKAHILALENYDCNKTAKNMIKFYNSLN
jgi:glycosyltransferase involved in cell wall biosynthesis